MNLDELRSKRIARDRQVAVWLSDRLWTRLDRYCIKEDFRKARIIRSLIEEFLDEQGAE
jgi:hypothetical protein|tara:strand:- start:1165 stop:1341 length:177 start_codon:yes stop_codon:yes gene_type:complete